MQDKELVERYKMALRAILVVTSPYRGDNEKNAYHIALEALKIS